MTPEQREALEALRDVMLEHHIEFEAQGSERFIVIEGAEKLYRIYYGWTDLFPYAITKLLEKEQSE